MTGLGQRFRQWRADRKILAVEAADLMGIKLSDLSSYELGEKPWPSDIATRVEKTIQYHERKTAR